MMAGMPRQILHVDLDEFFAAVEKLDDPALRGKAILVGGRAEERGVVATASYEARAFGCRSAMPMATAVRLCPQAIVVPGRGRRYRQVSEQVFDIFDRYTPMVEPLSIDEAFLDVTGCERLLGGAERIARAVKADVAGEIGLTGSVGVAPNKFLAKLASDLDKPDGLVVVTETNVHSVLDPLGIERLWGVGPAVAERLHRLGIQTIGQLRLADPALVEQALGSAAEHFSRLADGRDDRPVTPDAQAKSIGTEQTFATDVGELAELRRVLQDQTQQVARRLRRHELKARTVTVKLRYGDFTTLTRSATTAEATDVTEEIWRLAESLLSKWSRRYHRPLRLLGVTASQLATAAGGQLPLFGDPQRERQQRLDRVLDGIADRFGPRAVRRGAAADEDDGSEGRPQAGAN